MINEMFLLSFYTVLPDPYPLSSRTFIHKISAPLYSFASEEQMKLFFHVCMYE
jgi:hypothetical protein